MHSTHEQDDQKLYINDTFHINENNIFNGNDTVYISSFLFHIMVWIMHSVTCTEFMFPKDCQIHDSYINRGESLFALVCLLNFDIPPLNILYCTSVFSSGLVFSSLGHFPLAETYFNNPLWFILNWLMIFVLSFTFCLHHKECNKVKLLSIVILFFLRFRSANADLHLHHFIFGFLLSLAYTPSRNVCYIIRGICMGIMIQGLGNYTTIRLI